MDSVSLAIENARAATSDGSFSYQEVADAANVSRSTVSRRARGVTASRADGYQQQQKLAPEQESELAAYIEELTDRFLPPTRQMIQNFASEIAHEPVSDTWVRDFLHRNSDTLLYKWTTAMDKQRHYASSEDKYKSYLDVLYSAIEQYDVLPQNTYNMDEKGFAIGLIGRSKRVFSKASYEKKKSVQSLQDGNREWVTLLASVCADGSALPPGLIFTGADNTIQSSWVEDIEPGVHEVFCTATPSGWTNNQVGLAWLEQVFERYTQRKALHRWRLLIVDGHSSHMTMAFIKYCDRHQILLLIFPPHATHVLQPLDVVLFAPLASAYSAVVTEHLHDSQGLLGVPKSDFFRLFYKSWVATFREELIVSSFVNTGIWPQNPSVILHRFKQGSGSEPSTPPAIPGDDWRSIDRLYKRVVGEEESSDAKQLRHTLHALAARNSIVTAENKGLRGVIMEQNPSKKHRRTLRLQQNKNQRSDATLYSPRKVRAARLEARNNEQQQLEKTIAKHHQKEQRAQATLQNKLEKERRSIEHKKRLEASRIRRAEEDAERERRKQQRDAAKAIQLSQSGKRKTSSKPQKKPQKPKTPVRRARRGVVLEEPAPAPRTYTTRSGRTATQNY